MEKVIESKKVTELQELTEQQLRILLLLLEEFSFTFHPMTTYNEEQICTCQMIRIIKKRLMKYGNNDQIL